MRKFWTWAAIVLLLVVSLQDPVVSRTTPYGPEDFGPNPDHPWGGDQNSPRQDARPSTTVITGNPVFDITHMWLYKWLHLNLIRTKPPVVVTIRNEEPKPPQNSGTTVNPNPTR